MLRVVGREALHEVDLGADREGGGLGRALDRAADVVGRSRLVGGVHDGHRALRVHDHAHAGVLGARLLDLVDA